MPLDTGAVTGHLLRQVGVGVEEVEQSQGPRLDGALNIGAALRAERQRQGLSLQDVADATRVRRVYLEALEANRLEDLPSRPFAVGYVRAFAQILRVDPEVAVARFKDDFPDKFEPLRPPVGVRKGKDGRLQLLAGGLAIVIAAIVAWNVARHVMADSAPPPPSVPDSTTPDTSTAVAVLPGVLSVSAAEPAPQDSTLPKPYLTPGLDPGATAAAVPGMAAPVPGKDAPTALEVAAAASAAAPAIFTTKKTIYGAAAGQGTVILQAKKSVTLVVHNPDGSVFFARQLAPGESYRPPAGRPLTADVSDPTALNVYVNGQLHAALPAAKASLTALAN